MPANATLYLPISKPEIISLFPGTKSDKKLLTKATYYDLPLSDKRIRLNVFPVENLKEHLSGFIGYLHTLNATSEEVQSMSQMILGTKCVLGLVTELEFDDVPQLWQAILRIAQEHNGFIFHASSVLRNDGLPLVGPARDAASGKAAERRRKIENLEQNPSKEGLARKARSLKIVKKKGIAFIEHLPVLPSRKDIKPRRSLEVAQRALGLVLVCAKSDRLAPEELENLRKKYSPDEFLTPEEKRFVDNPNPTPQDFMQWSWRYEALWVLFWALGFLPELGAPEQMCDTSLLLPHLLKRTRAEFLSDASLRDLNEILDQCDLVYRFHWACVNARVTGESGAGNLLADAVVEWHYALNWLTRYMEAEWDDVSTDT